MFLDVVKSDAVHELTLPDRVRTFLETRGGLRRGQIHVEEHDGSIVLDGVVQRFYDRQVALSCAQHVAGVRKVIDRIAVKGSPAHNAGD